MPKHNLKFIALITTFLIASEPVVFRKENKIGYVDDQCRIVIPLSFYHGFDFHNGLAAVQKEVDGPWGFIDHTGRYVIPPKYDGAGSFSEGLAPVQDERHITFSFLNDSWGFIDKNGTLVVDFIFSDVYEVSDGIILGTLGKYSHFLDVKTKKEIDNGFGFATVFENGVAIVAKEQTGPMSCIDKNGTLITPYRYDWIFAASDGMMRMSRNDKYGFFDARCRPRIAPRFDYAGDFHEGRALVITKKGYGYIDKTGKMVIPPVYEEARDFGEGLAPVKKGGKWGYINRNGKGIIPFRFEDAKPFDRGVARVNLKGLWGIINRKGEFILPPRYRFETSPKKNHLIYTKEGEIFCVDRNATVHNLTHTATPHRR